MKVLRDWIRKDPLAVALWLAVPLVAGFFWILISAYDFGFSQGKAHALRDNAADLAARTEAG